MSELSPRSFLLHPIAAALVLAGLAPLASAQTAPDAGSILQQLQPALPVAPATSAPSLKLEPRDEPALPQTAPFGVKRFQIAGNTVFATESLHELVAGEEGKSLTLVQINTLAERITRYYQQRGYPLARAIIPVQTIRDGVVVIQVVEARYGQVRLNNKSAVRDSLLQATLDGLQSGAVIEDEALNRSLLLLSDVPGVGVAATLEPGAAVGNSDVTVNTTVNPATLGTVAVDNYGNRYVDRVRVSGNLNVVNPLHHGDLLSATVLSTGSGMNYGRLSYDILVNGQGTHLGAAYSLLRYKLGSELSALDANGTASVASLWGRHPLMRSRQANVYAQVQVDGKRLRDHVDASALRTDRHLLNWVMSINGDIRDSLLAGGISIWSLGWTSGRLFFDDTAAAAADAAAGQTRGGFAKWNANFSRLQGISAGHALYLNLAAQWSDGNLDSAEKMTAGGPYTVRGYDVGAMSGDSGYVGTIEWRHELGNGLSGQWQAIAFLDSAYIKVNQHPWSAGANSGSLSGAGVGLNWNGPDQWRASVSVASRVGAKPSMVASQSSVRAWATLSKAF
ncbi:MULTISPECIES: ShlB/FhaC/HecB family hemolysin secretion/activation protein [unclassified Herbaspirillum]|uniref:ShlB/FhaC/HecB family hemolysin secretion/activation protein n=1 Tax=unclassified Herbaspirillum TaxID=2624150 RepID=UPI00257E0875|nr:MULTISPECIES: ShlB/FhaC/HecB family hemolysin secretion/activation protein [unclassified Herbaspirillum]